MSNPPILILANHIDGLGGVERVAHGLSAGLSSRGYDVTLRGIRPTAGPSAVMEMSGYSTGFLSARRERPEGDRPHPAVVRRSMRTEAVEALRETLERYRDGGVVICMQVYAMEHLAEIGIESIMDAGTRIIGQYHWSYDGATSNSDFSRIWRTYRQIDKFLLLTQTDAAAFRARNFNNTGSMPNPLWIEPAPAPEVRDKRVVTLSRYDEVKQLDHTLRAWARVAPRFPDWRLELYGDGPCRSDLQKLIHELGIADTATLMGSTDDVQGVLLNSRLSMLSSLFEGLPMVLAESLACAVPAIAYDCAPGVSEIVNDGVDGMVVPLNQVSGLATALEELMSDESRLETMGARGRESARRYAASVVMDRWEDLLRRVTR